MARYDFRTQRLFVDSPMSCDGQVELNAKQSNYLGNVLRMKSNDRVLVFNGTDGEWLAEISAIGKKSCMLNLLEKTRDQTPPYSLQYLFAPLKSGRLDYMIQKAVEMGAGRLRPVITQHTQNSRIKLERLTANAVEAAEQCGILNIPPIDPPEKLADLLNRWNQEIPIIYCDEHARQNSSDQMRSLGNKSSIAILIGPEGGFSRNEQEMLKSMDFVTPISLGPRILRADTAAVAAMAYVQSTIGDWSP